MPLDELQEFAEEHTEEQTTAGRTNVRMDSEPLNELKKKVNVSTNKDISPLVEASIYHYLGDEDSVEEAEEKFKEQLQDE